MRRKELSQIALIVLIVLPLLFAGLAGFVNSQPPLPIGDSGYKQANPFDSNPTAGAYDEIGTPTGTIDNVYDGDPEETSFAFYYGYTASGYVNVSAFRKPSDYGYTDFTITWIDIKISYKAGSLTTNDDRYRILAYVAPSATPVVLQDWVTGNEAKYDPGLGSRGIRTFSDVAEPNDGTWDWNDLANLEVRFETEQVNFNNFQRVTLYEVWVTAYSTQYPASGTMSVQPSAVRHLHAGDHFFVDLYVTNVVEMWGFQIRLEFDPAVLMALGYFSYGPFVSELPSEVGPNYYKLAFKTYDGDPVGFAGNTPICRMYFAVDADGTSPLFLSRADASDIMADPIELIPKSGVFASSDVHDVAVADFPPVTVNATNVLPGESMEIGATVMNQGTFIETFDVTAFYDSIPIDSQAVIDLLPGDSEGLSFIWDTSGVPLGFYQIKVEATAAVDENPANNVGVWDLVPEGVLIGRHDIAVTSIVRAYYNGTVVAEDEVLNVTRRDIVYINATITNLGNFTETFNVTALWKGAFYIENKTDVSLDPGINETLTFEWNTDVTYPPWDFELDRWGNPTNFSRGDVRVVAAPGWDQTGKLYTKGVPYEKGLDYDYRANNDKTDGEVRVNRDVRYPTAKFGVSKLELFVSEPATFYGGPPLYSQTPEGTTIDNYRWDFGDGNVTEGNYPTITHAYASPGEYSVNITVTNSINLSSSTATSKAGAPYGKMEVDWRNVKIVSVDVSSTTVVVGYNVTINMTVQNDGAKDESLAPINKSVTVYLDGVMIGKVLAPDLGAWYTPTNQSTVALNWTTSGMSPGTYTIKAVLDALPYENDTDDNTMLLAGELTLLWHNIKVTSVTTPNTEAVIGKSVPIDVTVVNEGNFTETFTVTVYYNDTALEDVQTVTDLAPDGSEILSFSWNTDGLESGVYILKAVASNVTDEAQVGDNIYTMEGSVTLKEASNIYLYVIAGAVIAVVAAVAVGVYFLKVRKPK